MRTISIVVVCCLGASLILGCQTDAPLAPEQTIRSVTEGLNLMKAPPPQYAGEIPQDDVERLTRASLAWRMEVSRTLSSAKGWREADAVLREALARPMPQDERFLHEQTAAGMMLHAHLLRGPQTPDRIAGLRFYTEMLIRNDSPEAAMIGDALEILQHQLEPDDLRSLASAAASAGEVLLARTLDCQRCDFELLMQRLPAVVEAQSSQHIESVARGVQRLHLLAGSGA